MLSDAEKRSVEDQRAVARVVNRELLDADTEAYRLERARELGLT
jgi:hypothetical protein